MSNLIDEIVKNFHKKPYSEDEIVKFLELSNATEIEVGKTDKCIRFYLKVDNQQRTLFIIVDRTNNIKKIILDYGKVESLPSDLMAYGCLAAILIPIGLFIWFIITVVSTVIDGPDTDVNSDPNNPYIEDFDGDGVGGTKNDHDIYHKQYK